MRKHHIHTYIIESHEGEDQKGVNDLSSFVLLKQNLLFFWMIDFHLCIVIFSDRENKYMH